MNQYFSFSILVIFICIQRNRTAEDRGNAPEIKHIRRHQKLSHNSEVKPINDSDARYSEDYVYKPLSGEDFLENQSSLDLSREKLDVLKKRVHHHSKNGERNINFQTIVPNNSLLAPPKVDLVVEKDGILEINEDTDRLQLDQDDDKGSNLWIYSNVVCILLVIGLAIFLIYYPSNEKLCKSSKSSSISTSSSSVSASSSEA